MVGFAWSPSKYGGKAVFRGGFGVSYNQNEIAITTNGSGNPPNAVQANYTCPYPFNNNPSCAGTGILYETATSPTSIFGYAPNPNTITTFGPDNLPINSQPILVSGFPSNPKSIVVYHYSFDFQYQLPANWVMTMSYMGNQTRHLLIHSNWNAIGAAAGFALNPKVNNLNFWDNSGDGNFNAGIFSIAHNFSHSFQISAAYTWSKAMDENSGPYYQDPYPYSTSAAYGRSNYNATNMFKLYGLWQPTFFHDNSWRSKIVDGWTLSGIWNLHSGFPWNPYYNINGNVYYSSSGYGQLRPAAIAPGFGTSTSNSAFMQAINPNYGGNGTQFFLAPSYVQGPNFPDFGPAPLPGIQRNSLNSPGYNDVDLSLSKAFGLPRIPGLGERAQFLVRVDVYNFFNKTNINSQTIDANLGSVAPNGTVTPNSDFGVAGGALGSRTVQLQARFSF